MADERFAGDMSRNEVEIDLNKFMELVTENSNLKAKIVEMEANKEPDNPWQRWIFLSNMIDKPIKHYRVYWKISFIYIVIRNNINIIFIFMHV